jgi:hypothetical protein
MVSGINKSTIFEDDQDRAQFLDRFGENVTAAYDRIRVGLMTDHVHILFKSGKEVRVSAVVSCTGLSFETDEQGRVSQGWGRSS